MSVETCDQALAAIARPGLASVQIILNAFRRKPLDGSADRGWGRSRHHRPGAARVRTAFRPVTRDTTFAADDHRSYNAHGEAFDVGETFSGVGLEAGVDAAAEFAAIAGALPGQRTSAQGTQAQGTPAQGTPAQGTPARGPRLRGPRLSGRCGG